MKASELQIQIERELNCKAKHFESVTVAYKDRGMPYSRAVETFDLEGHPTAKRAYAWRTERSAGTDKPDYHIELSSLGINSAEDAIKKASDSRWGRAVNED